MKLVNNIFILLLCMILCSFSSAHESFVENAVTEPDYQTVLPYTNDKPLDYYENLILTAYLNSPNDAYLSDLNALHNIYKFNMSIKNNHIKVERAVYALYFLHRSKFLGKNKKWISKSISEIDKYIALYLPIDKRIDHSEETSAQKSFLLAFTKNESDRHKAGDVLLGELLERPANPMTNLYLSAVNLWNASEAPYANPKMLQHYLLASFFAERTLFLSKKSQMLWLKNSQKYKLFRDAPMIGGFTIPARRWLAKLHGDQNVVDALDEELVAWLNLYPENYSWVNAVIRMQEQGNLQSAMNGYLSGVEKCTVDPVRTCTNTSKAPYNIMSFALLGIDLALKSNNLPMYEERSMFEYYPLNYDTWTLFHEPWRTRRVNANLIQERYNNESSTDDPVNAFVNVQKWGVSSTCQGCHQSQGLYVSDDAIFSVPPTASDDYLFVKEWPFYSATWYGRLESQ